MVLLQNDKIIVLPFFIKISFKNSWKIPKLAQFIPEIYNNFYYKILGYFWGVTKEVTEEDQMYLHRLMIGVGGEVVQGSIKKVLHQKQ